MKSSFWKLRKFLLLWLGQSVSQLGSNMKAYALIVWVYRQQNAVMSVALLAVCGYVPYVAVAGFAGALVDRLPKKPVMLAADLGAGLCSAAVLIMAQTGMLRVSYLYAINAFLGLMNAFQSPASSVAVSLLVPREHYMRASGLQSFSNSLQGILAPVIATAILAFGGLAAVVATDLATFAAAFVTLGLLIRIPEEGKKESRKDESFWRQCGEGLRYVRAHKGILHLLLYLVLINLLEGTAYYSVLSPMVLARTGGNMTALGLVNACIGAGTMLGAALVTLRPVSKDRVNAMCLAYALSFLLCDTTVALGRIWPVWCIAALVGNLPVPWGDAALTSLLRESVPTRVQGRVFSLRNAWVNCAITAGYLLGAVLADHLLEPLMAGGTPLAAALGRLVGDQQPGAGMALIFLMTGLAGFCGSLVLRRDAAVRALDIETAGAVKRPE
ncbi:MAG: MFS transporter [Eubacteriales bacterium]|nr:MFS transporter [Eubacteriales bacterium]